MIMTNCLLGAISRGGIPMADAGLKALMNKLGRAVNDALTESEEINAALQKIRDQGYEIFLTVEATAIGSNTKKNSVEANYPVPKKVNFRLTLEDAKFLKQLKISVDDYILE